MSTTPAKFKFRRSDRIVWTIRGAFQWVIIAEDDHTISARILTGWADERPTFDPAGKIKTIAKAEIAPAR